jgi:hypothetical protein
MVLVEPIIYILIISIITGETGHTEVIMQPDASACVRYEKVVRDYLAEKGITPVQIYCERGKSPNRPALPLPKEKPKPQIIKPTADPPPPPPAPKKVIIKKALRAPSHSHCQMTWHTVKGHKKWFCKNKRRR